MKAFLLIDYQNDFVDPKGALYVKGAEKLAERISKYVTTNKGKQFLVASQDRHPAEHMSFASQHKVAPFTQIGEEMKRPDHCIKDTRGAELYPPLKLEEFDHVVHKAMDRDHDSYSAFGRTELDLVLEKHKIHHLIIAGVATDYCVNATVQDALKYGYEVTVYNDMIAAVSTEGGAFCMQQRMQKGVRIEKTPE